MVTRSGPNAWFADSFFSCLIFTFIQSKRLNRHLSLFSLLLWLGRLMLITSYINGKNLRRQSDTNKTAHLCLFQSIDSL